MILLLITSTSFQRTLMSLIMLHPVNSTGSMRIVCHLAHVHCASYCKNGDLSPQFSIHLHLHLSASMFTQDGFFNSVLDFNPTQKKRSDYNNTAWLYFLLLCQRNNVIGIELYTVLLLCEACDIDYTWVCILTV